MICAGYAHSMVVYNGKEAGLGMVCSLRGHQVHLALICLYKQILGLRGALDGAPNVACRF